MLFFNDDENKIILGKKYGKSIVDKSKDNILLITSNVYETISNPILESVFSTWKDNIIVLDYEEKILNKTSNLRENVGKVLKFDCKNLFFDPFNFIKEESYYVSEIEKLKLYKEILEEMYEVVRKNLMSENFSIIYKKYVIDLLEGIIFYMLEEFKEVNISNLNDFSSFKEKPLEERINDILNKSLNPIITKPIVNFFNLNPYTRDDILIIINILISTFDIKYKNKDISSELLEIFTYNKFSLYISFSSEMDNYSKAKTIFLLNQILKNKDEIKKDTLFILSDFNIFSEIGELRKIIQYSQENFSKLKLFLVSDINNLFKFENSINFFFNNIKKILFYKIRIENFKNISTEKDLKKYLKYKNKNKILYFNNSKLINIQEGTPLEFKINERQLRISINLFLLFISILIVVITMFNSVENKNESLTEEEKILPIIEIRKEIK